MFSTGCGAITAGTVVKKGGMWLAQQGAKKVYKKYKEDKEERHSDEFSSDRRHGSYPRRERHHED